MKLCLSLLLNATFMGSIAAASDFNFNSMTPGSTIPLLSADQGNTATFASPDGSVFSVLPSFFSSLTGNVLLDTDGNQHQLYILFNESVSSVVVSFALDGNASSSLSLLAFSGGVTGANVGSALSNGSVPIGFSFPEGTISFSGAMFDTVLLTSSAPGFAIGNLTTTPVPEATFLDLVGLASVAICAFLRGRKADSVI
jgi:hypothetical protein